MNIIKYYVSVLNHKSKVFKHCLLFSLKLIWRGIIHDYSKFGLLEARGFSKYGGIPKDVKYDTPEYWNALLNDVDKKVAVTHHYKNNKHHPEHHKNGINDMGLLSITEMFCDWKAATNNNISGNIRESINKGKIRFKYDESIKNLLINSIKD
jgi:hypothetical protein